jgi:hypothetical protein
MRVLVTQVSFIRFPVESSVFLTVLANIVLNNTGFMFHGNRGAWNVLLCSVNVVSVNYRYTNGSLYIRTTTTSDLNMARRFTTMLDTGDLTTRVPNAVDGAGLLVGDYASSFALELSRELAAMSANLYEPGNISDLVQFVPGIGSKLQLAPLILLLVALLLYRYVIYIPHEILVTCNHLMFMGVALSLTILPMAAFAALASRSKLHVTLARQRLIDPLTVVHSAFDSVEGDRTWENSTTKLFSIASDKDRLNVGPMFMDDGVTVFGVSRKRPV